jgi:GNAT superfamily N-acetyltransferase
MTTANDPITTRLGPAGLSIRLRTEDDDPAIIALRAEDRPWMPALNLEEYRWQADRANDNPGALAERWVAEVEGQFAGLCVLARAQWLDRPNTFSANVAVAAAFRQQGVGSVLHDHLLERIKQFGGTRIYAEVSAGRPEALPFAEHRGYVQTGRMHRLSRLLVDEANLDGYEGVYDKVASTGITLRTLSEIGLDDRVMLERIHKLFFRSAQDIPSTETFSEPPIEVWLKGLDAPGNSTDQFWIALDGDQPAGLAAVSKRGADAAFNEYTGVDREYRGRGIARALKLKTIEWAKANGVSAIYTANDYENAPMLSINIPLGYVEVPAEKELSKDLD